MHEALFYTKQSDGEVTCHLCAHNCVIKPGKLGICAVRQNLDGTLYTLVYNLAVAMNVDPIEKKPLFHFHPGSTALSVSTMGCNFHCAFCQNWTISQVAGSAEKEIAGREIAPAEIVNAALASQSKTIAYTYTEPTIFFEYAFETARLACDKNIQNIFVTNGYITREPLEMIAPYLHGANVDLKCFNDASYRKIMGAKLAPVLDTLRLMKQLGIWIEVTTLVIPGLNDTDSELREIAHFIAADLGPETPWHISRFHPDHKLTDIPATPIATLARALSIGIAEGLEYVYTGNVPGDRGEHTHCPHCRRIVIERFGFQVNRYEIKDGRCRNCGHRIDGIGI